MKLFRVGETYESNKCGGCNYTAETFYLFAKTQEEADKEYKESGGMCAICIVDMMADNPSLWEIKK